MLNRKFEIKLILIVLTILSVSCSCSGKSDDGKNYPVSIEWQEKINGAIDVKAIPEAPDIIYFKKKDEISKVILVARHFSGEGDDTLRHTVKGKELIVLNSSKGVITSKESPWKMQLYMYLDYFSGGAVNGKIAIALFEPSTKKDGKGEIEGIQLSNWISLPIASGSNN